MSRDAPPRPYASPPCYAHELEAEPSSAAELVDF
jgi:hypothetical protein